MNTLEQLFEIKEYQAVADLCRSSKDPKERLLRLTCLVILGKDEEALDDIDKYQSLIEGKYPQKLMKLHLELLLKNRYFDEAKIALAHYNELPYISQAVEEFLREIPKRIDEAQNPRIRVTPLDEILDTLETETDNGKLSEALFSLKSYNLNTYVDSLVMMLTRTNIHPNLRTYGLILLVDNKYDREVEFINKGEKLRVNPSKINPPFSSKLFSETTKKIHLIANQNTTVKETALQLINYLVMDLYPYDIDLGVSSDIIAKALVLLAKDYVKEEYAEDDVDILITRDKIKEIIESTPTLSI